MLLEKIKLKNLILITPFLFCLIFLNSVNAQTENVSIFVKLSVCGDGVVEGSEDCEGLDLNGASCENLGFLEGELSCDPSCSFNTAHCVPIPEPEPEEPILDIDEEIEKIIDFLYSQELIDKEQKEDPTKAQFLKIFDSNNDGILTSNEIPSIVITWLNAWTKSNESPVCDLNNDSICNIYDFSILLYYIST